MQTIKEETDEEEFRKIDDVFIREESLPTIKMRNRIRSLGMGWLEYITPSGRLYYYNSITKEKSWKPPRKNVEKSSTMSLPVERFPKYDSRLSLPEYFIPQDAKPGNVGKILRTGVLKTKSLNKNNINENKEKWVKSFVVLTELYVLFTTMMSNFRKLFNKNKNLKPSRFLLINAEVTKERVTPNGKNIYKLKTEEKEILFKSKNATAAEAWYQEFTLVINNYKCSNCTKNFIKKNSGSLVNTEKSVSLSDFAVSVTTKRSARKCFSDFLGTKYPTPPGWITIYDSETQQFCYVNSITKRKWFRMLTNDGHPYFYEKETGRRSWLLPSIYLDFHQETLQRRTT